METERDPFEEVKSIGSDERDPFNEPEPIVPGAGDASSEASLVILEAGTAAEPEKKAARSANVASEGKKQEIPEESPFPVWPNSDDQDQGDRFENEDGSIDYHDLESVNKDLSALRIRQSFVRRKKREAERHAAQAKTKYNSSLRRRLVQQTGGSAETRKAMAELFVEELEIDWVIKAQVADEWNTLFRSVRDEIENVKTVSYNLRGMP